MERPPLTDPRWLIFGLHGLYDLYALWTPWFDRSLTQWAAAMGACLACEAAVAGIKGVPFRWLSAAISGLGLYLLCDSPFVWPYAALGAVAILSKSLFRDEHGHVFNPTDFAMVAGLLLLPDHVVYAPNRWAPTLAGSLFVGVCGLALAWRARRHVCGLAYEGAFLGAAVATSLATGARLLTVAAPMTGAGFQLFTFYMITDPATSPDSPRKQAAFGAAVGLLDAVLRRYDVVNAPFFALFAASAVRPLLGAAWRAKPRERAASRAALAAAR